MILTLFGTMLTLVTTVAFLKPSGNTGMDVARIQQQRYEADLTSRQSVKNSAEIAHH
jgi:hypothetical protein